MYNLNLRNAPGGDTILTVIAYQTTVTSTQRTESWFFVSFEDMSGEVDRRALCDHIRGL